MRVKATMGEAKDRRQSGRIKSAPLKLGSRLVLGAIAGLAGTMAMTAAMRRGHAQLPRDERYPLTPREIVDEAIEPAEQVARDTTVAAHFVYGAVCGAILAAINPRPGRVEGAAAGLAIWTLSYMGWIPSAGLLKPAIRHPARRNLLMISVHFVWGATTASALRELSAARETIFAGGPEPDRPGSFRADRTPDARNELK